MNNVMKNRFENLKHEFGMNNELFNYGTPVTLPNNSQKKFWFGFSFFCSGTA